MAVVRIPQENRTIVDRDAIATYLAGLGIQYEVWKPEHPTSADAPPEEILGAYSAEIERLKQNGGYVTADVINVNAQTPNLDAMLARFSREHWHDEDEVRFIIHGRGIFHVHPKASPVVAIEVEAGDLIRVPRGTLHWFDLCSDRQIRAIRLFQEPSGWTPTYTDRRHRRRIPAGMPRTGRRAGLIDSPTVTFSIAASNVHGILLDIEGTTTPIRFVSDVLFPYVRVELPDYLKNNLAKPEVLAATRALKLEHDTDVEKDLAPPHWKDEPETHTLPIVAYVNWLMDQDRKSTALKKLQGLIWYDGYLSGRLHGEVFPDVRPAMERWEKLKLDVRIFSSGSELAQRLLFRSTDVGDLTQFLSGYYDTTIGSKTDPASYVAIAKAFLMPPEEIVFVSDITRELDAARESGFATLQCIRPGNHPQVMHGHRAISSFDEIED